MTREKVWYWISWLWQTFIHFHYSNTQQLALQVWRLAKFRSGWSEGDFANWIKILFFERFCSKPIITPAYYIMADWPDWAVPYNGEFYFLNRAKNDKFCPSSVQYCKWPPTATDAQNVPQMILYRKWSPNWTANDPKIIGMAWTQVSGSSCQFYCN